MNHSKKNRHNYCDEIDALAEFVIRPQVDLNRRYELLLCTICAESQIKIMNSFALTGEVVVKTLKYLLVFLFKNPTMVRMVFKTPFSQWASHNI